MSDPLVTLLMGIAVTAALLAIFWPESGLLARWRRGRSVSARVRREDALKHLHRGEMHGKQPTTESLAGALHISTNEAADLLQDLEALELVDLSGGELRLTKLGQQSALHIMRAHRLWERYLADRTGYSALEWHELAEEREHSITPQQADELAAQLGYPTHDPHGDPIPDEQGQWTPHGGMPLMNAPQDKPLMIVHIEDEPEAVYAQILAEELHPGMEVRLIEVSPRRVRFWAGGDEHILAPIVSANISVRPMPAVQATADGERLSQLPVGEKAEVLEITSGVRGSERRRLLDLGLLPGTVVTAELASPQGDPKAYRIRDALIALREEQAERIAIRRLESVG
ncbi:MAG: metal-dependent transcriptional regulator [Anaerolineales bacterium]|jgi:DtxR family Mn-dependent transcriptional regulator